MTVPTPLASGWRTALLPAAGVATGCPAAVYSRGAVGLAGDQVQRARGGGAEDGAEVVVAHGVVLGVVPDAGDGVAVVVVHGQAGAAVLVGAAGVAAGELDELVHRAAVVGLLLGAVVVVLVAGDGLRRARAARAATELGLFGASRPAVARVLMFLGVFFAAVKAAAGVPVPCWVSPAVLAALG